MIAAAAARSGLSAQWITHLENSEAAIEFLEARLRPEDVVLVKGSRGIHMDLIVAALEVGE
jgi:UDP-N-acetylmuramoyl-tripeptide--D-alanyl-D-alanine ligase